MYPLTLHQDSLALIEKELDRDPRLPSAHTKQAYLRALIRFEKWRAQQPLSKLLVEEYLSVLQAAEYAPGTINQGLAAIRWYARRLGDLAFDWPPPEDPTEREQIEQLRDDIIRHTSRIAAVPDVRGERVQPGRAIGEGELAALMQACAADPSPADVRDGAIIALAALTGLRRGEVMTLDYDSIQLNEKDEAGGVLIVRGKGNKDRKAFIYSGAALAMADWLTVRGHAPGPLFVPINKGGVLQPGKRLGRESLRKMLNKRARQAGIASLTWHDFRRTFAGNLLDASVDLATVQALMGHSSPVTTSRYDRRGEQVRRRAVQKLFVPYTRRALPIE